MELFVPFCLHASIGSVCTPSALSISLFLPLGKTHPQHTHTLAHNQSRKDVPRAAWWGLNFRRKSNIQGLSDPTWLDLKHMRPWGAEAPRLRSLPGLERKHGLPEWRV